MPQADSIVYPAAAPAVGATPPWLPIIGLTLGALDNVNSVIVNWDPVEDGVYDYGYLYSATAPATGAAGAKFNIAADSDVDPFAEWAAKDDPSSWRFQALIDILQEPDDLTDEPYMSWGVPTTEGGVPGLTSLMYFGNATGQLRLYSWGNWGGGFIARGAVGGTANKHITEIMSASSVNNSYAYSSGHTLDGAAMATDYGRSLAGATSGYNAIPTANLLMLGVDKRLTGTGSSSVDARVGLYYRLVKMFPETV